MRVKQPILVKMESSEREKKQQQQQHNNVVLLTTAFHMNRINFNSSLVATIPHPASTTSLTKLHVINKCYRMTYLIIDVIESMDRSSAAAFSISFFHFFAFNFNHNPFIISAWSDSIVYRTYIAIRLNIMANRHFQ